MGYSVVRIEEIEPAGPGGAIRFVRRELGGVYRIEGEEVPFAAGTIFRFDPESTRQPVAGPDGFTMVAIGARHGSDESRGAF
jgi:hypothetical protein